MNGLLCVTAIAAFFVAPNLAIDCSNNLCKTRGYTHTMCKYPNPNPAAACGQVFSVGLTEAEKTEILNKHNELREFVTAGKETRGNLGPQPRGYTMNTMFWDDKLAEVAQRWANQCSYGNDECRDVGRFVVGQNVGVILSSNHQHTTPSDVLMTWYNEVKDMDKYKVNIHEPLEAVSHYTQLVWGATAMVGCGKIVYRADGQDRYYMVCNYAPAGNRAGDPVYVAKVWY